MLFRSVSQSRYPTRIGAETGDGAYFNGWIDELRVTKDIARYVANFTAPTVKFPD